MEVRELSREDIEKDLTFVGFIIISCPLKPDSKAVVKEIRDASHHVSHQDGLLSRRFHTYILAVFYWSGADGVLCVIG